MQKYGLSKQTSCYYFLSKKTFFLPSFLPPFLPPCLAANTARTKHRGELAEKSARTKHRGGLAQHRKD